MRCDCVIVSDWHLGSRKKSRPKLLLRFLEAVIHETLPVKPAELLINGDLIENLDFRRWLPIEWEVLRTLRTAANYLPVKWLIGNHDGSHEAARTLAGSPLIVLEECERIFTGDATCLVMHGHAEAKRGRREREMQAAPPTSQVMPLLCDQWHYKRKKLWEAVTVARAAVVRAKELSCSLAVCGHTHGPFVGALGDVQYANTGSWTRGQDATYVVVRDGKLFLETFSGKS